MYRVVLTCWDPGEHMPYPDDFSGVELSLFESEHAAREAIEKAVKDELTTLNWLDSDEPREKEPIEDSDGNIIGFDYPFRGDEDGDHVNIVRFWDGDDYQEVTAYDIHELGCDNTDLEKCSYFKYRGFWILPNEDHTSFKVEQFDVPLFARNSLKEALREVDEFICKLQYGKPSLETVLARAAITSKERETSDVKQVLKTTSELQMT